jgi:hypothetical protein
MDIYKKNIDFLKEKFPAALDLMARDDFSHPQLWVLEDQGSPVLQLDDRRCFLHSTYNIEREMQQLFKEAGGPDQTLFIFGFGLGHCLDYLKEHQIEFREVHIIEPFCNIFKALLARRDLDALLRQKVYLHLVRNPSDMRDLLWSQAPNMTNLRLLYHLSYRSIFSEFFEEMERLFADRYNLVKASVHTTELLLYSWTRQQLKSLKKKRPLANVLYDQFPGIPAIIVSAGPSLERHFDLLSSVGDRALIIAPGTGAQILNRRGIKAHLVMAIDASEAEVDLFKDYRGHTPLIGSFRLHPRLEEEFSNLILRIATATEYLSQYYYRHFQDEDLAVLNDQPSVSIFAVDYAFRLGCNPIILIGQDLCRYGQKYYADDREEFAVGVSGSSRNMHDINGVPVVTDDGFLAMRHVLEIRNQEFQDRVKIINATEAGLGIPGIENQRFGDCLERYIEPGSCDVAEIIESVVSRLAKETLNHDIITFYQHLLEQIDQIAVMNKKKLTLLKKMNKMKERGLKAGRLAEQVKQVEEFNGELEKNDFYREVVFTGISSIADIVKLGLTCITVPQPGNYCLRPDTAVCAGDPVGS